MKCASAAGTDVEQVFLYLRERIMYIRKKIRYVSMRIFLIASSSCDGNNSVTCILFLLLVFRHRAEYLTNAPCLRKAAAGYCRTFSVIYFGKLSKTALIQPALKCTESFL